MSEARPLRMHKGATLLISILILGALFLSFAIVGVQGIIREGGSLITITHKKTADALASACLEEALFDFASRDSYTGGETLTIGGQPCAIRTIRREGADWIIETEARVSGRTARLRAILSSRSPATIRSLEPVAQF